MGLCLWEMFNLRNARPYPSPILQATRRDIFVEIKIGDIYTRNVDRQGYRVKRIDHTMVILESYDDKTRLSLTSIFGLRKSYTKRESKPTQ